MYEQAIWASTNVEVINRISKQTMKQLTIHQFFHLISLKELVYDFLIIYFINLISYLSKLLF